MFVCVLPKRLDLFRICIYARSVPDHIVQSGFWLYFSHNNICSFNIILVHLFQISTPITNKPNIPKGRYFDPRVPAGSSNTVPPVHPHFGEHRRAKLMDVFRQTPVWR